MDEKINLVKQEHKKGVELKIEKTCNIITNMSLLISQLPNESDYVLKKKNEPFNMTKICIIKYDKLEKNTSRKIFNPFKHLGQNHDKGFEEKNIYVQNMTTL